MNGIFFEREKKKENPGFKNDPCTSGRGTSCVSGAVFGAGLLSSRDHLRPTDV